MDSAGAIRVSPERSLQAGHSEGTGCFQGVAPPTPPDPFLLGSPLQKKSDPPLGDHAAGVLIGVIRKSAALADELGLGGLVVLMLVKQVFHGFSADFTPSKEHFWRQKDSACERPPGFPWSEGV